MIKRDISYTSGRTKRHASKHLTWSDLPSRLGAGAAVGDHPDALVLDLLSKKILRQTPGVSQETFGNSTQNKRFYETPRYTLVR